VVVPIELPFDADAFVGAFIAAITPRTKLALVDHVTSPTGLVLPIERIVRELTARGVETLVDGAHAPGMVALDVAGLGAAYYTGNLHKWVCAPKGAAFLWVRPDRQERIRPLVISHGANSRRADRSRFRLEFDWLGTADPSAWLAVPAAIEFGATLLPGGWPALRDRNRELTLEARAVLASAVGSVPAAPDEMIGSMASVPLGWDDELGTDRDVDLYGDRIHGALLAAGFQTMLAPWPQRPQGRRWQRLLRLSAAAYNDLAQYERLAAALPDILAAAAA
jgi:isopenicillin-N epimerase